MLDPLLIGLLFLALGIVLGGVLGMWWQRLQVGRQYVPQEELETTYVSKDVYEALREQADVLQANLHEKVETERDLSSALATEKTRLEHLQERLEQQMQQIQQLQESNRIAFENMANRLLDEKSQKFTQQNQAQLSELLQPLKEKIKHFEDNIERRYLEETRDRVSLKKEIEQLRELNQQLSQDAGNLTAALKGDSKVQGDWGEVQLQLLLEKAGLQRDVHFRTQSSFRDQDGKTKRPMRSIWGLIVKYHSRPTNVTVVPKRMPSEIRL